MTNNESIPVEPSGKAIQDRPTAADLARDFCVSRGWIHPRGSNAILTSDGRHVADNFEDLAQRMQKAGAFWRTPGGALQITQDFLSLPLPELRGRLG